MSHSPSIGIAIIPIRIPVSVWVLVSVLYGHQPGIGIFMNLQPGISIGIVINLQSGICIGIGMVA